MARVDAAVVIVNWNTRDALGACLGSLREGCRGAATEIWVVDNASEDGSAEMVEKQFPGVRLIRNSANLGLTRANNLALARAAGEFVLFLNSDAHLKPGAVRGLIAFMGSHPRAAAAGPRISWPDGSLQASTYPPLSLWREALQALHIYKLIPKSWAGRWLLGGHWAHDRARAVGRLTGACWIVRRAVLDALGGLDENFWDGSAHDFCLSAAESGWEIWFTPEAEAVHHLGASAKKRWSAEERKVHVLEETRKLCLKHRGPAWFRTHALLFYLGHRLARALRGKNFSSLQEVELDWYGRQWTKGAA